jgi:uncharacterized protein (TIGR00369 family)
VQTETLDPGFREKVKASFDRQGLMKALNGRLTRIDPGCVHIELPYSDVVTQQHGYFHAAAIAAIADNAGGYAALTLMEPDEEVVAAEFKINLLRPAVGPRIVAEAQVIRAGRMLVISEVTVSAVVDERVPGRVPEAPRVRVAMMLQTNCRVKSSHEYHRPR